MKAQVVRGFTGQPDNAPHERGFVEGELLFGALAEAAVAAGNAVAILAGPDDDDAPSAPPAKRAKRKG